MHSKAIENKKDKTVDIGNKKIWHNNCLVVTNKEMFIALLDKLLGGDAGRIKEWFKLKKFIKTKFI